MLRAGAHGRGMELKRVIPVWNCGRGLMLQIMRGACSVFGDRICVSERQAGVLTVGLTGHSQNGSP